MNGYRESTPVHDDYDRTRIALADDHLESVIWLDEFLRGDGFGFDFDFARSADVDDDRGASVMNYENR